jgi:hypothetical protein
LSPAAHAKLARAKARLDTLDLYPRPVRMGRVRLVSAPWLFRLPWFRRFDGYTMWDLILVRGAIAECGDDLITHELCHVWQMQHHPIGMPLSYLYRGYADNPNEVEARRAAEATRFGLCNDCLHQRLVRSGRGSVFTMCLLAKTDPAFPKYPRVPVLECAGHERES